MTLNSLPIPPASRPFAGSVDTDPLMARRAVVRRLTLFYSTALLLVALIVSGYAVTRATTFEPRLAADQDGAQLAMQQQAFGLSFSRDAFAISSDITYTSLFVEEMHSLLPQFKENQARLRGTQDAPGIRGLNTNDLDVLYAATEPHYQAVVSAINLFLAQLDSSNNHTPSGALVNPGGLKPYAYSVVAQEQVYVYDMESIAERYRKDADVIQQQEAVLDKGLVGLTILALLLVGMLVFRPATQQVGRSIDELAQAQEQQRELAALKDQFIIYANHELRTPVMGLYNSLELLDLVNQQRDDPERRARLLQRALTAGDALIRLLQNVLDTSVVEAQVPRLELGEVPLAIFARVVLETFNPREIAEHDLEPGVYQSRAVTMDISPDLVVLADEGRLRQVMINLLSNALKYSPAGTPISITASAFVDRPHHSSQGRVWPFGRRHGGATPSDVAVRMARVSVRDRGLGVPPRDASKLFNRFIRLERDIASTVRGTGVGLYLCRVLVEAMGGHIWVESSGIPGDGATFIFTLPLATPSGHTSPEYTGQMADAPVRTDAPKTPRAELVRE